MTQVGRPRNFDRDQAVEKAMLLFWKHGFDSTSLNQLKTELGISSASFYAAFKSKELIFREAVERYIASYGKVSGSLWDQSLSGCEALERTLRDSARMQTDTEHPLGCLLVVAIMTSSIESEHLQELLRKARNHIRKGIVACLKRARDAGEIAPSSDIETLSVLFETFLFGIPTQARDGASLEALEGAITATMALLPRTPLVR
jgi:AcrR family transcriptional regulator